MNEPSLESVQSEARILLARFLDPALAATRMDMVRALRPEPDDYARVFTPEVAEAARVGYGVLWENLPPWPVRDDQVRLEVAAARSEDFLENNERGAFLPSLNLVARGCGRIRSSISTLRRQSPKIKRFEPCLRNQKTSQNVQARQRPSRS